MSEIFVQEMVTSVNTKQKNPSKLFTESSDNESSDFRLLIQHEPREEESSPPTTEEDSEKSDSAQEPENIVSLISTPTEIVSQSAEWTEQIIVNCVDQLQDASAHGENVAIIDSIVVHTNDTVDQNELLPNVATMVEADNSTNKGLNELASDNDNISLQLETDDAMRQLVNLPKVPESISQNNNTTQKITVATNTLPNVNFEVVDDAVNDFNINSLTATKLVLADGTQQGRGVLAQMGEFVQYTDENEVNDTAILVHDLQTDSDGENDFADGGFSKANQDNEQTESTKNESVFVASSTRNASYTTTQSANKSDLLPNEQISSSIKETFATVQSSGKKGITINLFPETLGPIKIEITSIVAQNGVKKLESIKVLTDRRETLEILERSRVDLEKSLKEVSKTKEDTSLQFEMNQQNNGQKNHYFASLDDKNHWMNNFIAFDPENAATTDNVVLPQEESGNTGYITADSVNIRV